MRTSNLFCNPDGASEIGPHGADIFTTHVELAGNHLSIDSPLGLVPGLQRHYDLTVESNSRMSGTFDVPDASSDAVYRDELNLPGVSNLETKASMVKLAELPTSNWFNDGEPSIGSINGITLSRFSETYSYNDRAVNCFSHSKGRGMVNERVPSYDTVISDYESIVVSTDNGREALLAYSALGELSYWSQQWYGILLTNFDSRTSKYQLTVEGVNPIKIHLSADASSDASSDAPGDTAELDIDIDI